MIRRQIPFLLALWKANLQAAMEYRGAFLAQVLGMMLNNAVYFVFWILFFDRFKQVNGWNLNDMLLLFGIAAGSFGLGVFLFGNLMFLGDIIAKGRLDYYLSLPRPVLLHALASRSITSGLGDFTYGMISFMLAGQFGADTMARFFLGLISATAVFVGFMVLVQSLAFWLGNSSALAQLALNAIVTFALYPISLFDNTAKFLLFTLVPAAFMGAIPAGFVRSFSWSALAQLTLAAIVFLGLAVWTFRRGLRRYESGSAIQIET
jgi:ABC-2 type transport system permease protein